MYEYIIDGVHVEFPFAAYPCQIEYMTDVIKCLQSRNNGILESPTGTGKTLCLLCASLAWLENHRLKLAQEGNQCNVKIFYASRTHSQLAQVMKELKNTRYGSTVKACIIGSRDQLCVNAKVREKPTSQGKISACRLLVKKRSCRFHIGLERNKTHCLSKLRSVSDIEDLVNSGTQFNFCPYYAACFMQSQADIVLVPYNYLLDPRLRHIHNIDIKDSVIIMDEAHNIENICEDVASAELSLLDVRQCLEEVNLALSFYAEIRRYDKEELGLDLNVNDELDIESLIVLRTGLKNMEDALSELPVDTDTDSNVLYSILQKVGVDRNFLVNLEALSTFIAGRGKTADGTHRLSTFLSIVTSRGPSNDEFRVYVEKRISKKASYPYFYWWCFNPALAMQSIQYEVRSILITSGTLSPLEYFSESLSLPFPTKLRCSHVIDPSRIYAAVVSNGPDQQPLCSSYFNRTNDAYLNSFGRAVINIVRITPHGVLLFFSSYVSLETTMLHWEKSGIRKQIEKMKKLFIEPRNRLELIDILNEYRNQSALKNGAILCVVARGKVSEGIDFSDSAARAVIISGLPYPPRNDCRVRLKMKWLERRSTSQGKSLTSQMWYEMQAFRALNQAAGRVIRHIADYGAIIFCDNRFKNPDTYVSLPLWIKDRIMIIDNFGKLIGSLRSFYRDFQNESSAVSSQIVTNLESQSTTKVRKEERRPVFDSSYALLSVYSESVTKESINRSPESPSNVISSPITTKVRKEERRPVFDSSSALLSVYSESVTKESINTSPESPSNVISSPITTKVRKEERPPAFDSSSALLSVYSENVNKESLVNTSSDSQEDVFSSSPKGSKGTNLIEILNQSEKTVAVIKNDVESSESVFDEALRKRRRATSRVSRAKLKPRPSGALNGWNAGAATAVNSSSSRNDDVRRPSESVFDDSFERKRVRSKNLLTEICRHIGKNSSRFALLSEALLAYHANDSSKFETYTELKEALFNVFDETPHFLPKFRCYIRPQFREDFDASIRFRCGTFPNGSCTGQ